MEKTRQQELTRWLKQQSVLSRRWLMISRLLGLISGLLIVAQAWLLARILNHMIMENIPREALLLPFIVLILIFILRAWVVWLRERVGFHAGQHIRYEIRRQVLDRLQEAGPAWIQGKPAGSWATLILEQIDDMHDYYARYLPQMALAVFVPLLIVIAIFPVNWMAALILMGTAPLIPLFMALVGMGAADANRRNFLALGRLSGHFLDRLRGMELRRRRDRGGRPARRPAADPPRHPGCPRLGAGRRRAGDRRRTQPEPRRSAWRHQLLSPLPHRPHRTHGSTGMPRRILSGQGWRVAGSPRQAATGHRLAVRR